MSKSQNVQESFYSDNELIVTLEEAYCILSDCRAVITQDGYLVYPKLSILENDPDNEFVYFEWEDSKGNWHKISFREGDNEEVVCSEKNSIILVNSNQEEIVFEVLGDFDIFSYIAEAEVEFESNTDFQDPTSYDCDFLNEEEKLIEVNKFVNRLCETLGLSYFDTTYDEILAECQKMQQAMVIVKERLAEQDVKNVGN